MAETAEGRDTSTRNSWKGLSLQKECTFELPTGSNLLMNNFPLIQLSHRLGHADPHVTLKVYSHFVKGMEVQIEEYMEKLG